MLIISKDSVANLVQNIASAGTRQESIDEVRRMLEIKQALLWRSDIASPCCGGSLCSLTSQLTREVAILEKTVAALENGDDEGAIRLLEDYCTLLEEDYENHYPGCC